MRFADDGSLRNGGMGNEALLDLRRTNAESGRFDQVVGPALVPEIAVVITYRQIVGCLLYTSDAADD